jgi:hypothetical protein
LNFIFKKEHNLFIRGELGKIVLAGGLFCFIPTAFTLTQFIRYGGPSYILFIIFFVCSVIGISSGEGIQVDHKKKRVRSYTSILWMSWGTWFPLENFKCVSVGLTGGVTQKGREMSIYKIYLIARDPYKQQGLQLGESAYKNSIIKRANKLGQKLKMPVVIR